MTLDYREHTECKRQRLLWRALEALPLAILRCKLYHIANKMSCFLIAHQIPRRSKITRKYGESHKTYYSCPNGYNTVVYVRL